MADNKQQKKQKQQKSTEPKTESMDGNNKNESSLSRISKIPMVELSIAFTLSIYNRVKSSNDLLNNVLTKGENLTFLTFEKLKPVANKFENQVNYVDSLLNTGLDKMQSTFPNVMEFRPRVVYANAHNKYISWRNYTADKVNYVRNFNLTKTTSGTIQTVEGYLDHYLPATEDESNDSKSYDDSLTNQSLALVGKLRKRVTQRARQRMQNIQRIIS